MLSSSNTLGIVPLNVHSEGKSMKKFKYPKHSEVFHLKFPNPVFANSLAGHWPGRVRTLFTEHLDLHLCAKARRFPTDLSFSPI